MSSSVERRSSPTAWAAFWFALAGLVLMPIPLFIGLILGGGLSIVAAVLWRDTFGWRGMLFVLCRCGC